MFFTAINCLVLVCLPMTLALGTQGNYGGCCFPDQVSGTAYLWQRKHYSFYWNYKDHQQMTIRPGSDGTSGDVIFIDYANQKWYDGDLSGTQCTSMAFPKHKEFILCMPYFVSKLFYNGTHGHYQYKDKETGQEWEYYVRHIDDKTCVPIWSKVKRVGEAFKTKLEHVDLRDIDHDYFNNIRDNLVSTCDDGDN